MVNAAAGNDILLDDVVNEMATRGRSNFDFDGDESTTSSSSTSSSDDDEEDGYEDAEPYDHRGQEYDDDDYKDEDEYDGTPQQIGKYTNMTYNSSSPRALQVPIGDKSPSDGLVVEMDADEFVDRNNGNPFLIGARYRKWSHHDHSSNLYDEDGDETTAMTGSPNMKIVQMVVLMMWVRRELNYMKEVILILVMNYWIKWKLLDLLMVIIMNWKMKMKMMRKMKMKMMII